MDVREHMDIADAAGTHVGTVDKVEAGRIKLTKKDSPDGKHHFLDAKQIAGVEGNKVKLKEKAASLKLQAA